MRLACLFVVAACGRVNFDELRDGSTADAYDGPNRVFVSSMKYTAALGGFAGANATCQGLADAAGLGGEFVLLAWDQASTEPSTRLVGSRGWVDMKGRPVADLATEFDEAAHRHPMLFDENGATVASVVFTGHNGFSCTDFTSETSFGTGTTTLETLYAFTPGSVQCAQPSHVFCVERGRNVAIEPLAWTGRLAFLSTGWSPGTGLSGADATCNADASAAGLPGGYRAFLGSSAGGPETRFTAGGPPWHRVDGVLLATTSDEFLSGADDDLLLAFLTQTAGGGAWNTHDAWIGVTGAVNCSDWMSTALMEFGGIGKPGSIIRQRFRGALTDSCAGTRALVCLQL